MFARNYLERIPYPTIGWSINTDRVVHENLSDLVLLGGMLRFAMLRTDTPQVVFKTDVQKYPPFGNTIYYLKNRSEMVESML